MIPLDLGLIELRETAKQGVTSQSNGTCLDLCSEM